MRFRCNLCGTFPRMLEFEDNDGKCPRCGANEPGKIAPLIDVHLMVMHEMGPILGRMGRQYVACQRQRAFLCRHADDPFAASDEPSAVTCPACLRTDEFRESAALSHLPMMEAPTKTFADMSPAEVGAAVKTRRKR